MKIAGNSFAALARLAQEASANTPNKAGKKAGERAALIAQVREAQAAQVAAFKHDPAGASGDKRFASQDQSLPNRDKPLQREAVGPRRDERAEPGQVLNIVI